jgi:hypothetical protein
MVQVRGGFPMLRDLPGRLCAETVLAVFSAALFVVTLVSRDWIEIIFRVDPDRGNGWLEWAIAAAAFGLAVTFALIAGREWRRTIRHAAASEGVVQGLYGTGHPQIRER